MMTSHRTRLKPRQKSNIFDIGVCVVDVWILFKPDSTLLSEGTYLQAEEHKYVFFYVAMGTRESCRYVLMRWPCDRHWLTDGHTTVAKADGFLTMLR
ncbi:hypothetical protein BaRGS_00009181 [Batillaria attramentaria]|uniref:Uncharacterized protein n=1 Tax=Batillaria attramentaria TaxID=370345 RepID=A0ABD0LJ33_9CAEN